jgi:hypothetical protein
MSLPADVMNLACMNSADCPFSPWVRLAVERLWDIGTQAEAGNDVSLALQAYQGLRSSLYAVQSFYLPYRHWIPKSDAKIAALMARTTHHPIRGPGHESTPQPPGTRPYHRRSNKHLCSHMDKTV